MSIQYTIEATKPINVGWFKKKEGKHTNHKCDICSQVFTRNTSMLHHRKLHKDKMLHSRFCTVCGLSFGSKYALGVHYSIKHPDITFQCNLCQKKFLSEILRNSHKGKVHAKDTVNCLSCGQFLKRKSSLENHRQNSCGIIKFKPWEELGKRARRARAKFIIDVLSGAINRRLDDRNKIK